MKDDMGQAMVGNMTQQSVLNAFDFSAIEEMDPSLGKWPQHETFYYWKRRQSKRIPPALRIICARIDSILLRKKTVGAF